MDKIMQIKAAIYDEIIKREKATENIRHLTILLKETVEKERQIDEKNN